MTAALDADALDRLFLTARTRNAWQPKAVPEALLRQLYDLAKWGPTSANVSLSSWRAPIGVLSSWLTFATKSRRTSEIRRASETSRTNTAAPIDVSPS